MKSVSCLLLPVLVLAIAACGNRGKAKESEQTATEVTTGKTSSIQFVETAYDFGQVKEGEKVAHTFVFSNTGKADLVISDVKTTCGCTTPKYDKKPIRPGKTGSVEVAFDTKGRPGKQRKSVVISANTYPPRTVVSFTCEVLPAKNSN